MSYCGNQTSLFGPADKYIKFYNSDLVAVEGANIVETQILRNIRIPYTQVLRGRITLAAGQVDYLLNHLGLGDNATLVSIAVTYDPKSKIEEDNYVQYAYYNDMTRVRTFCEIIILTGNTTNRIPQLYLSNPNTKYPVTMDVMVAKKGTEYAFFQDILNQSGTTFIGLTVSSIMTHVVSQSIKIVDSLVRPLIYMNLSNISSIGRSGLILTIDDSLQGEIFLKFTTSYHAAQSFSLLNYIKTNPGINTALLNPLTDDFAPVINFWNQVGNSPTASYITVDGATAGPYNNLSTGTTFSTSLALSDWGTISNGLLLNLLVGSVSDNRDGLITISSSNIQISQNTATYSYITMSGTYSLNFINVMDLAENVVSSFTFQLIIT
jgi:hypothetical protein